MEILAAENLTFSYPDGQKLALNHVGFSVNKGDFVTLCGGTGSGKSTLLRLLKREISPLGEQSGKITLFGVDQKELDPKVAACKVGFVFQRPEMQLVTDKVWHELAFGPENMGLPTEVIRRRVAEMACFFGMEEWFEKPVNELSGGQKQLLALASVMVMQPEILLLDEPTARLDPIAASDFLSAVGKLNRELSLTVILAEHRTDEALPLSNRLMVLEDGNILSCGEPRQVIEGLSGNDRFLESMPAAVRLYAGLRDLLQPVRVPLNVREGRQMLEDAFAPQGQPFSPGSDAACEGTARTTSDGDGAAHDRTARRRAALEVKDLRFRYRRDLPDVLRGVDLTVYEGERFCLLGGNGSGKSTLLSALAGLIRPYGGSVRIFGKRLKEYTGQSLYKGTLSMLTQDVQTVFLHNTVREELEAAKADLSAFPYDFDPLLDRHPYDLSGGQQQLLALAVVLASHPRLLLLDEPGKGLDAPSKRALAALLRRLTDEQGITVVAVTHDAEFAADIAHRCALFFGGEIVSTDEPKSFFAVNSFYTTAVSRMTRGIVDGVVTVEDAIEAFSEIRKRESKGK
ncbi:MAG: ABC transporter ATP-binding protein [Eubacteriales bacterium]